NYLGPTHPYANQIGVVIGNGGPSWQLMAFSGTQYFLNSWYHVAFSKSGDTYTLYINGQLKNQQTVAGVSTDYQTRTINLGHWNYGVSLIGHVDEVEIFDHALPESEIAALYNASSEGMCRPCTKPPAGLVSWWSADGDANDSVDGNNGALMNSTTYGQGMVGPAFSFDGVDDFIEIPDSPALAIADAISIDAWFKTNTLIHGAPIYNRRVAVANDLGGVSLELNNYSTNTNTIGLNLFINGGWKTLYAPAEAITIGRWYHVAGTYNGTVMRLYLDGIEVNSMAVNGPITIAGTPSVVIGRNVPTPSIFFNGLIDEVEIFNRALSDVEIAAIYNAGASGQCRACPSGMVSLWKADNSAADSVGTYNGTLNGTTYAPGKVGQAFSLDGVDDYVNVGDLDLPSTFTIEAWINPDTTFIQLIMKKGGSYQFFVNNAGTLDLDVTNTIGQRTYYSSIVGAVTAGQWNHVASTYDGSAGPLQKVTHYINGLAVNSTYFMAGDAGGTPANNSADTTIGSDPGPTWPFSGLIDELAVFNRVLSLSDIQSIHNASSLGKCYALDTVPDIFPCSPTGGVQPNILQQTSFTVTGINSAALISISGGQYAIGGCEGTFTSNPGMVNSGDIVCVRVTSSTAAGGTVSADLTIGGVTSTFAATTLQYYARVTPGPKNYSASLTDAYTAATLSGDIIEAFDHPFNEDLDCNGDHAVTLNGGYNSAFDQQVGLSTLSKLTVSGTSSLTVSGVGVQ
ncbi:MAG: LamG domain-containing protein, partial [Thermodesulfovibrionales bacterium]